MDSGGYAVQFQSLTHLQEQTFPEPRWVVPGLIPDGLTLLAGPPKVGKSMLALDLACAVATGGKAFDSVPVEQGGVVYLALEDPERRLQQRVRMIMGDEPWPKQFIYRCAGDEEGWSPRLPSLIEFELNPLVWTQDNNDDLPIRLLVIDVLAAVRPIEGTARKSTNAFQLDYQTARSFKDFADRHQIPTILLHHTRKASDPDFVSEVSGTHGLAGAADTIAVLKRDRTKVEGRLSVTGREVEERDLVMSFDEGRWTMLGDSVDALVGNRARVVEVLARRGPSSPMDIYKEVGISPENARKTMRRMARDGQLDVDSGLYRVPTTRHVFAVPEPVKPRDFVDYKDLMS